jgi:two-component system, chemotaxis family, sensor kinase CheA
VLRDSGAAAPAPAAAAAAADTVRSRAPGAAPPPSAPAAARSVEELGPMLVTMAERLARDHDKRIKLSVNGLGEVPARYAATVKDCIIQMLRNSAVHGIEAPNVRRAHTKQEIGAVSVAFRKSSDGYELVFEDDGAGIKPETLKAAAVRSGLITQEEAAGMDTRTAMALIFRPGFSTQDGVSMDAGRGVGMDVVARSVYALGGKIGVSTHPGKFTRFKIVLPAADAASSAVA